MTLVKSYTRRAKTRIVYRAAAAAWMQGVPWSEALDLTTKALARADGDPPRLKFSRKGKGRGKGKQKGLAKGKGKQTPCQVIR